VIGLRARRLFAIVACAFVVLILRLAWIQLGEHAIWAEEAARLVHSGRVIPYKRGAITDANGVVLARDVLTYDLTFEYRPFRRSHPLGQVAHARTSLEVRAVTYREASQNLVRWAEELVELVPADVEAFEEGAGLSTASLAIPACAEPRREARFSRAADVRFYVRGLLGASARQWSRAGELAKLDPAASYLELVARTRDVEPAELLTEAGLRWQQSLDDLDYLAREIVVLGPGAEPPFEQLLDVLEESRRAVEGAAASALFEEAAGFSPGRVSQKTLLAAFDLEELCLILRWDEQDLGDWARRARERWRNAWRDGYALPRLVEQLTLDPAVPADADRVVSMLAALFGTEEALDSALNGEPHDWRELEHLGVFADLADLFRVDLPQGFEEEIERVLPWQDPALRTLTAPAPWALLDDMRVPLATSAFPPAWSRIWEENLAKSGAAAREERYALVRELVDGWENAADSALAAALTRAFAAALPEDLGESGGMRFKRGRLDRLEERAAYVLKDFGARPRTLLRGPSYDVVYLLAGFPERYPGFEVRDANQRERVTLPGDERPLAEALIGSVSRADVRAMQRQRADELRYAELSRKGERTPEEEDEFTALVESVLLPEELNGVAGIEGFFDPELRGRNGYLEERGLDDVFGEGRLRAATDGLDVGLTLVAELQRAAERTINHPALPDDPKADPRWTADPVGAIVLITPEGDVLAAASAPLALDEGDLVERALRRPTFQPPGSVFKPFVAAWALDQGLDPAARVECAPLADGRAGYRDVRCWNTTGHGSVDLSEALMGSCNAYFAWLGEGLSTPDFRGVAQAFGFGQPTGVRTAPLGGSRPGARGGLIENVSSYLFQSELKDAERRRAANGLAVVEATPLQVARATAGLATGRLPALRLVGAVGGVPLEREPARPLPVSADSLERVRAGLLRVAQDPLGTASRVLSASELGFVLAAKTGSADLLDRSRRDEEGRVQKHGWVACYAPPEDPLFVAVVFVHDTSATASHGAVYVLRQFLEEPEVRAHLAALGLTGVDEAAAGPLEEQR
jgi:cell division protein FtsI/penicillin-binding protein 2